MLQTYLIKNTYLSIILLIIIAFLILFLSEFLDKKFSKNYKVDIWDSVSQILLGVILSIIPAFMSFGQTLLLYGFFIWLFFISNFKKSLKKHQVFKKIISGVWIVPFSWGIFAMFLLPNHSEIFVVSMLLLTIPKSFYNIFLQITQKQNISKFQKKIVSTIIFFLSNIIIYALVLNISFSTNFMLSAILSILFLFPLFGIRYILLTIISSIILYFII